MHDMTKEVDGNSMRYNSDKIVYSNVPPSIVQDFFGLGTMCLNGYKALAEHYTLAAAKYPNAKAGNHSFPNWAKGQLFESFVIDSMLRHFLSYENGEAIDAEFGSHHLISVAWGAASLHHFFSNYELYKEFDDRKWVGFESGGDDTIINLILRVQTTKDIEVAIASSFQIFVNVLVLFEMVADVETFDESGLISQRVNKERLERVKQMKFEAAQVANKGENKNE